MSILYSKIHVSLIKTGRTEESSTSMICNDFITQLEAEISNVALKTRWGIAIDTTTNKKHTS
jgi:hypothetical protein